MDHFQCGRRGLVEIIDHSIDYDKEFMLDLPNKLFSWIPIPHNRDL